MAESRRQDYEPPTSGLLPLVGLFGPTAVPARAEERTLEALVGQCWGECPGALVRALVEAAEDAVVTAQGRHAGLRGAPVEELAAVYLYTAETQNHGVRPLYATLNGYLRARNRDALGAYRGYVRLLLLGLRRLEGAGLGY